MIYRFFLFVSCISLWASESVWQLGKPDGKSDEFGIRYFPWEYGRTAVLPKNPDFDAETNTFRFRIPGNGAIAKPAMISGISSESMKNWMFPDEVVTSLKLEWNESEAGFRKITFHTSNLRNMGEGKEALELILPNQTRKLFSFPVLPRDTRKDLALSAEFSVKKGENTLLLRAISMDRHLRLNFDFITLEKTEKAETLTPNADLIFSSSDFTYEPNEKGVLRFKIWNFCPPGTVSYEIRDFFGKTIRQGKVDISNAEAKIDLPTSVRGWYEILYILPGGKEGKTSFAVLEPVRKEYIDNSRFGCHAVKGFAYLRTIWKEGQEKRLNRAWRAGAKWVRLHNIKWADLQPKREVPPDWSPLNERISLLERYKMNIMLQISGTPKWASPVKSERLVPPIGVKEYQVHPPENEAWKHFIAELVSHCKGRIRFYEIWNEPNYQSCFWLSGSPKDYALLIKTAYQAAKESDPGCRIVAGGFVDAIGFLAETLRENAGKAWFDVLGFHYVIRSQAYERWRAVLKEYPDMPLFNTEESWWKSNDPSESAAKVIKGHVIEAAYGVAKTFAFGFFDNRAYSPLYGCVGSDGAPLPAYAAYRTMTHRLEHTHYAGSLTSSSDPLKLHLFLRDRTPVIVGWNEGKIPAKAELFPGTASAAIIDLMDRETIIKTENGKAELTFSPVPQFLEGGDPDWLLKQTKLVRSLPSDMTGKPGSILRSTLPLNGLNGIDFQLTLPDHWKGSFDKITETKGELKLEIPKRTAEGIYIISLNLSEKGKKARIPVRIRVSQNKTIGNLIRNGDFSEGGKEIPLYWFKGKKGILTRIPGGGTNGTDAWRAENRGNGGVHWGATGKIKVLPGEQYLLTVRAKGEKGTFGIVSSISDSRGKRLSPVKEGINMLYTKTTPEWNLYHDTITITHPDSTCLNISMLVNHASPGSVTFDQIALYELNDRYPVSKRLWKGFAGKAKTPVNADGDLSEWKHVRPMTVNRRAEVVLSEKTEEWNGPSDLSATCRVMRDSRNLYLAFEVRDNAEKSRFAFDKAWRGDSIQIAFDPLMEGQDFSDLVFAEDPNGKPVVWRYHKFWTPELLTGVTSIGELKSAQLAIRKIPGGRIYEAAIPLAELHPLTAESAECGFSFLVNDNDGKGRKFIEWSSGIGGKKNPKLFGLLEFEK